MGAFLPPWPSCYPALPCPVAILRLVHCPLSVSCFSLPFSIIRVLPMILWLGLALPLLLTLLAPCCLRVPCISEHSVTDPHSHVS